jgi:hypothetical protein
MAHSTSTCNDHIENNYVFIGLQLISICQADYKQLVQHLAALELFSVQLNRSAAVFERLTVAF